MKHIIIYRFYFEIWKWIFIIHFYCKYKKYEYIIIILSYISFLSNNYTRDGQIFFKKNIGIKYIYIYIGFLDAYKYFQEYFIVNILLKYIFDISSFSNLN